MLAETFNSGDGDWKLGISERWVVTNAQFSIPNPQFPNALIIGKKRGKLLTASIIEFDLLFNA
ncbi:MAG: hypothetical protein V7K57_14550 [Nostoc sp.]|uniref:hypothetical protein n=1 Tax=Nostoc sp. TaxID=1180 RepID=UPI002FF5B225